MALPIVGCLVVVLAAPPSPVRPRLFVNTLSAQGVEPESARAMTDSVVEALKKHAPYDIVTTKDLEAVLGLERQKQLLGVCANDPQACQQNTAEQLTARFLLTGQLSKLGSVYQLALQMVDTQLGQPVARSLRLADDLGTMAVLVPYAAAEATGSPLPPPPSKVLPLIFISVGAATFLSGAVLGGLALSRQSVVNDELCPTGAEALQRCAGVSLRSREYYLQQDASLGVQKTISLALLGGGAVLAVVGAILWPKVDTAEVKVALVPRADGFSLVGIW